jgi:O-antigen ligase
MGASLPKIISVDAGGSLISQLAWGSIYIVAIIGILRDGVASITLLRSFRPLIIIVALVFCSILWSEAPFQSAKQAISLLGSTVLPLYFVRRLRLPDFIQTLAIALGFETVLSVFLIYAVPFQGVEQDVTAGAWRGAFTTKNMLGQGMVLEMLTVACLTGASLFKRRALTLIAVTLCPFLLIGSQNVGSIFVIAILTVVLFALIGSRGNGSIKLALASGILIAFAAVAFQLLGPGFGSVLEFFGKDENLNGRGDLWQFAIGSVGDHPLLGYGYGAFFSSDTSTGQTIARLIPWDPNTAHNGYLEVALGIGLVGLATVLYAIVLGLRRAGAYFWHVEGRTSAWPLSVIMFVALASMSEAGLVRVDDLRWTVLVAAFLYASDLHQSIRQKIRGFKILPGT